MDHQKQLLSDLIKPALILDADTSRIVECNEAAVTLFQLSKTDLLDKTSFELSPAYIYGRPAKEAAEEVIQKALKGENPVFDWVHIDSKGKNLPCEIRLVHIPPYDKKLVKGVIIDKERDNEFRESEKFLTLTLQAAGYGVFENYPQQNVSYFDDRFKDIFKLPENGESLDEKFFSRIHPEDIDRVSKDYKQKLLSKKEDKIDIEYRIIIDGEIKYIHSYGSVFRDDEGEAQRLIGVVRDITSLRESQKELELGEERLRLAIEASNIGTFDFFPSENKVIWNHRLYEMFELDRDESIDLNEHFLQVIHPEDKERVGKGFAESLKKNGPNKSRIEYRIIVGKKTKHILAYSRMFRNDQGEVTRMLGTSQDITELRQYEEKLKKNEELLRSIIQDQKEMIVRWKPGGYRTFVNNAYCEMFELDEEEAIGKSFFPHLDKSIRDSIKKGSDDLTPDDPVRLYTIKRPLPNGDIVWQEWSDRAYFDEKGEVKEFQSVGRDITQIKTAEENLRKSEELFRSIVQDQDEMIVRWKPGGIRTFVNKSYLDFYELKSEEVIGTSFFDLIDPKDKKKVIQEIENLTPAKPVREEVHSIKRPDGSTGWQRWRDRAFFNQNGEAIEYQSVGRDITLMVEARKALEESEERYRNVFNQQFQFTALLDTDGRVLQINELPLKVQGLSREDYLGKYFWESPSWYGNKEWEKKVKSQVLFAKKTGESIMVEDPFFGSEKETRYANASYSVIKNSDGKIENILVQAIDITEQKKANQEVAEREQQLSMIHDNTNDYILLIGIRNGDYYFEEINRKCMQLIRRFGIDLPKDELIGSSLTSFFKDHLKLPKERYGKRLDLYDAVKKGKETVSFIQEFESKNGPVVSEESIVPILDKGKVTHLLVVARDITESYLSKQRIEASEEQLSLIYNSSNDFMLLIRVEKAGYFIESVNEATVKGLERAGIKVKREQLEGMNMLHYFENVLLYDKNKVQNHFENYNKIKQSKEILRYTTESVYNDQFFATDTTATPILEEGKVKYILTVSHDISDIMQSKTELQQAYGELEKLKSRVELENIYLKEEIKQANDFENMVFNSKAFRQVLNKVEQVAKTNATVLVTGETGTGKELIARAIHNISKRSENPMIKVNTAAIPKDLIESELFGHEKGAFTGASGEKPGKFELADGGTIFLDEIGDMPMDLQVKILRVLQEGEIERLGSTKTRKIDVRIISATNKDLQASITDGKFREDLFFRLNVFPIEIPPLRSRPEDVPILVEHFVSKYNVKHSKRVTSIPKKAMDYLRNYTWPGNVRELENTLERAIILTTSDTLELPEVVDNTPSQEQWEHGNALDVIQENHIRKVLKECDWKIEGDDGAAAQLKIKPSTLRDKMKKFNIKRPRK